MESLVRMVITDLNCAIWTKNLNFPEADLTLRLKVSRQKIDKNMKTSRRLPI